MKKKERIRMHIVPMKTEIPFLTGAADTDMITIITTMITHMDTTTRDVNIQTAADAVKRIPNSS